MIYYSMENIKKYRKQGNFTVRKKRRRKILKLAKPRLKGLLGIVFSRFLGILILIGIEIAFIVKLYDSISNIVPNFTVIIGAFTVVMVFYLFNSPMDSSAKLTWMILISAFPVPGTLFYAYTKLDAGQFSLRRKVGKILSDTQNSIPQNPEVVKEIDHDGSGIDDLSKYISRTGCYPIYKDTAVKYFPSGEAKLDALLDKISKAEKYIYMEYFIIEEGEMWGQVLEILSEKARQGVDVRVMYDGMCSNFNLPFNYPELMKNLGIKCKVFSPIWPFISTQYNYRDHRKIVVIDGKVAFTGGINLADEYINVKKRFGVWKDAAVMLEGDAARSFELMFMQLWNVTEKDRLFPDLSKPIMSVSEAEGYVMPYADSPLDDEKVGENVFLDVFYRATEYVHIMTPYLILDDELRNAIKFAAERDVDVKLILPGIPDKKMAYALAKSHYRELIKAGVKIYEYVPGFVHAKVLTSDDTKAIVGSINLDYRSLYHHFECASLMYRCPVVGDIEADFNETLKDCRECTLETVKHEKIFYKIAGFFMKILAPLM